MKRLLFVVASAALLMGQARPQQFDLVCPGTVQRTFNGPLEPQTKRIRIDLESRQWCYDDCTNVRPISEITATSIALVDIQHDEVRRRSQSSSRINRQTGEWTYTWIETRPVPFFWEERGTCTPEAFSGFPQTRF